MLIGEMLVWTNRIKEIRKIKDSHLRRQRIGNLKSDFMQAYGWADGIKKANDPFLSALSDAIEQEYFIYV